MADVKPLLVRGAAGEFVTREPVLPVRAATTAANEPVDGEGGFGEGKGERSRGSDSGIVREPADAEG